MLSLWNTMYLSVQLVLEVLHQKSWGEVVVAGFDPPLSHSPSLQQEPPVDLVISHQLRWCVSPLCMKKFQKSESLKYSSCEMDTKKQNSANSRPACKSVWRLQEWVQMISYRESGGARKRSRSQPTEPRRCWGWWRTSIPRRNQTSCRNGT